MGLQVIKSLAEFQELINGDKPVIIDFYADWCGPCKLISPKFEKLAGETPEVIFAKVNVDDVADVSEQCSIRAMPTFQAYKSGEKIGEVIGANLANIVKLVDTIKSA